jgi:hypothetical protein
MLGTRTTKLESHTFDDPAVALETLQPMSTLEVKTDAGQVVSIFVSISIATPRMHRNSTEFWIFFVIRNDQSTSYISRDLP